jgi:hypothetical protein
MGVCNSYNGSGAILVLHVFSFLFKTNPMLQSPSSDTSLKVVALFLEFYGTSRFITMFTRACH